jgi:hypothetical protein
VQRPGKRFLNYRFSNSHCKHLQFFILTIHQGKSDCISRQSEILDKNVLLWVDEIIALQWQNIKGVCFSQYINNSMPDMLKPGEIAKISA